MTVKELIKHLRRLPAGLPVTVADWNEGYSEPMELTPDGVHVSTGPYYPVKTPPGSMVAYVQGQTVVLGLWPRKVQG